MARRVFLALLVMSLISPTMAAPASSSRGLHRSQPPRFSDLAELTPANVHGLLPLVSRGVAARLGAEGAPPQQRSPARGPAVDSLASVDLRLQRFVDDRVHLQLATEEPAHVAPLAGATTREISYVIRALPISAHALVTAGGLVFYGTTDGRLKALDARTGRTLWEHRAEGRELDEPFSYRGTDGHQYIAVRSVPLAADGGPETLLIFALAH